ncbi:MAG TPA: amidohydrolase [Longimicrobiales bacterium]|nr:amidohydrolase [Longimicrobiales bacterium]
MMVSKTKLSVRAVLLAAAVLPAACASGPQEDAADLVLRNGHIATVDESMPVAEAVAIRGHTIVAVGTNAEIARYVGRGTEVIDLEGRLAMPGFIEGHGHFMGLGQAKMNLDLMNVRNWDEVVQMVAAAAADAPGDAWIVGRGWHQEKWDEAPMPNVQGIPLHTSLDSVSPNNPVLLTHASGHMSFANARALELAGITRDTPDPDGGEILRDADGNATGLLRQNAQGLASRARSRAEGQRTEQDRDNESRRAVQLAGQEALSKGVTSFHDAGASYSGVDFFRRLESEDELPIRLYVMIRDGLDNHEQHMAHYLSPAEENDFLVVRAIKVAIDGALGSHGAWLLEPYADRAGHTGFSTTPVAQVGRIAELAIANGFQLNIHAIGDRGNREVLDIYESQFAANPDKSDLRWRIEHAQHLDPADIPRFGEMGVIASMQGIHATSDAPWIHPRLGEERARHGAYVWRSLLDSGAVIANGTDVPVEDIDPIASFYASVSRRTNTGEVFYEEQRMTREEALHSYTLANAFAAFEEDVKGSITPGKLADIVVLSHNIMTVPEEEIPNARVDMTILGGRVVYRRDAAVAQ